MTFTNRLITTSLLWLSLPLTICAQKQHFEGEITYAMSVTLDKTARKFLKGSDGAYTTKTIYKNGDELSHENYYGTTTLLSRTKDSVYTYHPDIKKGYKCSYSSSVNHFKESRKNTESSIKDTGETKEMYGITFKRYKGEETTDADLGIATLKSIEQHDYWVCTDYDENWFMSICIPGMILSLDWFSKASIPILGEMTQHFDIRIKDLIIREVGDDELKLPSDVAFTLVNNMSTAESKLKKDHKKYMKERGKKVGENVQTQGAAKTKGSWDF